MSLIQLYVPTEVAHDTVAELGELGDVQFKDVGDTSVMLLKPSY
jgi:V-type H+-transporting ATPase subunit a